MHVSKSRRLLKPCLVEQCPHCRRIEEFWLVELSGQVSFIGGVGYSIACQHCSFEKPLAKPDAVKLDALAGQYRALLEKRIPLESFEREVVAMQLKAIQEIRNEGRVWRCANCKEENPTTFETCWKCSSESPVKSTGSPSPPRLPDLGGGHAWESKW
jgi:rubrerythrin